MPNNNKVNEAVAKSFKFLANLQSDQTDDPNYIPENMQPFVNSFVRNGRIRFDMLDKRMRSLDKSSDDYVAANREIERIAKSFITLKRQLDIFKRSQGDFKNLIPNINQGTKAENMHINTVIFGEQMDDFIIGEDGRLNFGIKASPKRYYKLDTLQDDYPMVTEPFNSKSYIYKKYEEIQLNKSMGKPFDRNVEYNKILYNIKQGGNSEVVGLAHTDLVGDNSTKSFADMWESGLADKSLYINPQTGEKLPKDSEWMKDENNADVLSGAMARHITNAMSDVYSGMKSEVLIREKRDEHPTQYWLPEVKVSANKSDVRLNKEVDEHLKEEDPEKKESFSDKIKTMPPRLFDYYIKKMRLINKNAKQGNEKHAEFVKSLPGGSYYKLLKQMKDWRSEDLTPSELIKKYSK